MMSEELTSLRAVYRANLYLPDHSSMVYFYLLLGPRPIVLNISRAEIIAIDVSNVFHIGLIRSLISTESSEFIIACDGSLCDRKVMLNQTSGCVHDPVHISSSLFRIFSFFC